MQVTDCKILVVEDSDELIMLWKALFLRAGFRAQFAKSGKDAIATVLSGYIPDILMTDFYLPDITGADLILTLRGQNTRLKCLVVTGNSNSDFKSTLPPNTEFLVKPVRFEMLKSTLEQLAGVRSSSLTNEL